ncbi:hypothetical protein SAMN05443572_101214 [Myxococcus fulvus]|uniref:Lipoprotein n=1 Tax=Myxococcus fulvus TaxID=33 RepID=A0A511T0T6_MYXFU|nr:hypothetical protein [Myxococcus fulvus]GEN07761.1 hypothetical protein MFU01_27980 [Myxococcus fulvus]SES80743.1 hypothetical protein SAMN05443572_101214 [Myxococcus fulvus]
MSRSRVLWVVGLLALGACGGEDREPQEEPGNRPPPGGSNPPVTYQRSNVTGTYAVTGTLRTTLQGRDNTVNVRDTITVSENTGGLNLLNVNVSSMNCGVGIRATMNGERTFDVVGGTCPMSTDPGCTASMKVNDGSGSRDAGGAFQLELRGDVSMTCGTASSSLVFVMKLAGTSSGLSAPDTTFEKLSLGASISDTLGLLSTDTGHTP